MGYKKCIKLLRNVLKSGETISKELKKEIKKEVEYFGKKRKIRII